MSDLSGGGRLYLTDKSDAALAPYYAGDFLTMYDNNPDLAFCYPKEGVNFFVDAICIPKSTQNKEAAELYINFLCEEEIAVANANYICYASPHELVLQSDDYELKDEPVLYPAEEDMPQTQIFENLDQPAYGFDALNNEYCDLVEKGILDPTKVSRSALQNAASVSATLLTTEALVVEVEDKQKVDEKDVY